MNEHDVKTMREQLSALADGELHGPEFARAVGHAASGEGQACWELYHVIGDALRGQAAPVAAAGDGGQLLQRLRAQLAQEGEAMRPASAPALQQLAPALPAAGSAADPAANDQVLRWKLAAGFASLAAVAVLGWHGYAGLSAGAPGAQLASARPGAQASAPQAVALTAEPAAAAAPAADAAGGPPVMIRDPRLDELLAAHRQLGNSTSALQMPAGFLRNADFAGRQR